LKNETLPKWVEELKSAGSKPIRAGVAEQIAALLPISQKTQDQRKRQASQHPPVNLMNHHPDEIRDPLGLDPIFGGWSASLGRADSDSHRVITSLLWKRQQFSIVRPDEIHKAPIA